VQNSTRKLFKLRSQLIFETELNIIVCIRRRNTFSAYRQHF